MKPFSKSELKGILIIFLVLGAVILINMQTSLRRARDTQRRNDIGAISNALNKFHSEFGYFPPSEDGKIKMCKNENFEEILMQVEAKEKFDRDLFFQGLRPCEWGVDYFRDVLDEGYAPYLEGIPSDPKKVEGYSYLYLSNTKRFQIFTYLEGEDDEVGYDDGVVARNLNCGIGICSFGKHTGSPLEKSIEDYEKELQE